MAMIRISKAPVAWPVPWDDGRRYFFRAGDVLERADFEAELAGEHRAGNVYPFEYAAVFAEGVRALLADSPDQAAQLIELAQSEAALEKDETLPAEDVAALAQARELLEQYWPAYRALTGRDERRHEIAPVLAFRRFCTGWEGEGLPDFALGADRQVSLETMAALPSLDIKAGGSFAYRLLYGRGGDAEKNSDGPLPSGKGPTTSPSPGPKGAGRSRVPARPKRTRSSGSRPGRSTSSTSGSTAAASARRGCSDRAGPRRCPARAGSASSRRR
jgi:hypothetical protein